MTVWASLAVSGGLLPDINVKKGKCQGLCEPALWLPQAGHASGVKPTVIRPEGQAITGRLMVLA